MEGDQKSRFPLAHNPIPNLTIPPDCKPDQPFIDAGNISKDDKNMVLVPTKSKDDKNMVSVPTKTCTSFGC